MTQSEKLVFVIALANGLCIGALGGMTFGGLWSYEDAMKQAYDRGYAFECLGKEGYYWECEK